MQLSSVLGLAALLVAAPSLFAGRLPGRYIVELTTEPVAEHVVRTKAAGKLRGAAAQNQRTRIRGEQDQVRSRLTARNATVLASVDTVANALIVKVDDQDAAQLASLPGVRKVHPVRIFRPLLDRAVALAKVNEAWSQIGGMQNAGAGMKIAIIDTGIDSGHPGFQDASLSIPDGYPRTNNASDQAFTNSKVIVARSYVDLLPYRDIDRSARDRVGHGTALGMISAGVTNSTSIATITGVAPRAWLGNYKVFGTPGYNDGASDDAILKALDDAVADGMDVINLSLGDDIAPRLEEDIDVAAVERASKAGVIVVVAAGNNGPDLNTMASPGTAPSAITVGATSNDRTFGASAEVNGLGSMLAVLSDQRSVPSSVSGRVVDVSTLDSTGLACTALPTRSLTGAIALISRGTCSFETKLSAAQAAGAVGALIHARAESPDAFTMAVGTATLPAEMIGYDDGMAIKNSLAGDPNLTATLRFSIGPVSRKGGLIVDFSAAGPNVDASIKPDLVAVGDDVYMATQSYDPNGDMYSASGYLVAGGTSFSTPLVAGAAALVKAARPGLTVDQYRSLLINSTAPVPARTGAPAPGIQQTGAGWLDVTAALNSTIAASPVTLSFGTGTADPKVARSLTLTNLGTAEDTFTLAAVPAVEGAPAPAWAANTVQIGPGASLEVPVTLHAAGLAAGPYQGQITVTSASTGRQIHVPYWYAATDNTPARITVLSWTSSGRRNNLLPDAIYFRITDAAGVPITVLRPDITVTTGNATVQQVNLYDRDVPGLFSVDLRLGPTAGSNVIHIAAGAASADIAITAR